jgi:hypothetical protein
MKKPSIPQIEESANDAEAWANLAADQQDDADDKGDESNKR